MSIPITIERCTLTRVGARFNPQLNIRDWLHIGEQLFAIGSCYQFLLGDWLNYGEREYGEKYSIACDEMGMDYGTVRNWASTCKRIELSRRRDKLDFSHHAEVAALAVADQDKWLDLAEQNKWAVTDLRQAIRTGNAQYAGENHGAPVKTWIGYATSLTRLLNRATESIETWTRDQRDAHKEALRPIVEFYERL